MNPSDDRSDWQVGFRVDRDPQIVTAQQRDTIRAMFEAGERDADIARAVRLSEQTVVTTRNRMGLSRYQGRPETYPRDGQPLQLVSDERIAYDYRGQTYTDIEPQPPKIRPNRR